MNKNELMQNMAREANERGSFTGAWLYAENGEIVSKGAVGFCDADDTKPITEDTIFQLASVSKQFTASAVMLMVRRGLLSLEDDITKFFPEIDQYKGVTIRHLLNHTSGIPDYFDDEDWFIKVWKEENHVPSNDEIVRFLCETELKPLWAPGEGFEYSNTGYNLLALVVERLAGIPYEEFLSKSIFEPAGMTSTRSCHIRRDGIPFENFARAMVIEDSKYVPDVDSEEDGEVVAYDGLNGDDYVYTNVFDMFTWDRALREGKVLTLEEQKLMYTPGKLNNGEDAPYDEGEGLGYGFGWAVGQDEKFGLVVSHSGGMPGVHTWFQRAIDADRVLVILCSRESFDMRAHMGIYKGFMDIAQDKVPEPIKAIEDLAIKDPDKSLWESFCGKYEKNEKDLPLEEIYMKDGDLWAKVVYDEDDIMDCKLYAIGENEFGRKEGYATLKFTGESMIIDGKTECRKL